MNDYFPELDTSGKQCRERYINYVRFSEGKPKNSCWSEEDDQKFTNLYLKYGAKWAFISKLMPEK